MSKNTKNEKEILKFNDLCLEVEKFHQELIDIDKFSKSLKGKVEKFNFDVFDILNQNEKLLFLRISNCLSTNHIKKILHQYSYIN